MPRDQMQVGDHILRFEETTHIMGVINLSPESNNPQTVAADADEAIRLANRYRAWGADLIDVGGQSSHFDTPTIAADAEAARVIPAIEALAADGFIVSIDTWKPIVAEVAIKAGAVLINDTGGLSDPEMRRVVVDSAAGVIVVHVDGDHPHAVGEVELRDDKAQATAAGFRSLLEELGPEVARRTILDPGIAINYRGDYLAYTRLQMEVIRSSHYLTSLRRPLLIPIPRKRDIHWVSAYIALALENRADIIRVHDVAVAASLVRLWGRKVGE